MLSFLKIFFFLPHDGFEHLDNYSKVNFGLPKNKKKIFKNKYSFLFFIKIFLLNILKFLWYPFAFILYLLNFRIILTNSSSIGSCVEELESIIKRNLLKKKFNLIFFSPNAISHNQYAIDQLFSDKITIIKNNFVCLFFLPLTFIKFITTSVFIDEEKKNNICIFQKQFFNYKSNIQNFSGENFSHYKILKNVIEYKEKFKETDFDNLRRKNINNFEEIKKKYQIDKNFCVIHVRNEKIHKLRNCDIENYYETINFLILNNFKVFLFYDDDLDYSKIINNNFFFHFNKLDNNSKKIQFNLILYCDLFIGTFSGPFHIANIISKKILLVNTVIYNHLITRENVFNLPKKFILINNSSTLKINDIFENKLECVWEDSILEKNKVISQQVPSDILKNSVELIINENVRFMDFSDQKFHNESQYVEFLSTNCIPSINYYNDLK